MIPDRNVIPDRLRERARVPFDRTYEGLKHEVGLGLGGSPPAFDRTYEGLKQGLQVRGPRAVLPFDRTYEGLKPAGGLAAPRTPQLLTVPVRV